MCKMLIKLNEVTNATKEVIDATTKLNSDLPTRWRPDIWSNRPELDQQTGSTFLKAWPKCALLLIHSECPVIVRLSFMSHYFVPRFSELLTLSRTHLRYLADLTFVPGTTELNRKGYSCSMHAGSIGASTTAQATISLKIVFEVLTGCWIMGSSFKHFSKKETKS